MHVCDREGARGASGFRTVTESSMRPASAWPSALVANALFGGVCNRVVDHAFLPADLGVINRLILLVVFGKMVDNVFDGLKRLKDRVVIWRLFVVAK